MMKAKNLRPFRKGKDERRNLKGRPKSLPGLDQLLTKVLGNFHDSGSVSTMEKILRVIVAKALKGDLRACELLLDRAYGRTKQAFEGTMTPVIKFESPSPEMEKILDDVKTKLQAIDDEFEQKHKLD